jgi:hypothetical protein
VIESEELEVQFLLFLNSEIRGGKWLASRLGRFTCEERYQSTFGLEGWGGGGVVSHSGCFGEEKSI